VKDAFDRARDSLAALAVLFRLRETWGLRVTESDDGKLLLGPGPVPAEALELAQANRDLIRKRLGGKRR
jgi:hypothetical protein